MGLGLRLQRSSCNPFRARDNNHLHCFPTSSIKLVRLYRLHLIWSNFDAQHGKIPLRKSVSDRSARFSCSQIEYSRQLWILACPIYRVLGVMKRALPAAARPLQQLEIDSYAGLSKPTSKFLMIIKILAPNKMTLLMWAVTILNISALGVLALIDGKYRTSIIDPPDGRIPYRKRGHCDPTPAGQCDIPVSGPCRSDGPEGRPLSTAA